MAFWSLSAGFLHLYLSGSEIAGAGLLLSVSSMCFPPRVCQLAGLRAAPQPRPRLAFRPWLVDDILVLLDDSVLVPAPDDHTRRLVTVRVGPWARKLVCILGPDARPHQELPVLRVLSQPAPLESSHQPLCSVRPTAWGSEPGLTKAAALYFFCSWGSNHGNEIR